MLRRKGATSGKAYPRPNWIVNKKQKSSIEKAEHQAFESCADKANTPLYPFILFTLFVSYVGDTTEYIYKYKHNYKTNSPPPLNPLLTSYI